MDVNGQTCCILCDMHFGEGEFELPARCHLCEAPIKRHDAVICVGCAEVDEYCDLCGKMTCMDCLADTPGDGKVCRACWRCTPLALLTALTGEPPTEESLTGETVDELIKDVEVVDMKASGVSRVLLHYDGIPIMLVRFRPNTTEERPIPTGGVTQTAEIVLPSVPSDYHDRLGVVMTPAIDQDGTFQTATLEFHDLDMCAYCGRVETNAVACEEGWQPYFFLGQFQEAIGQCCSKCYGEHLMDFEHEPIIKDATHAPPGQPLIDADEEKRRRDKFLENNSL